MPPVASARGVPGDALIFSSSRILNEIILVCWRNCAEPPAAQHGAWERVGNSNRRKDKRNANETQTICNCTRRNARAWRAAPLFTRRSRHRLPAVSSRANGVMGITGATMDPDRQLEHLTKTLNLSADQQSQIKPLLVDRQQKMQALWQDQSLSQQDRRSKAQAIREGHTHKAGSHAERSAETAVRSAAGEDAGAPAATDGRHESGAHRSTAA